MHPSCMVFCCRRAHARKFLHQGVLHFTCASSTMQQDTCEVTDGIWSTVLVDTTVDDYMLSLNTEKGYGQSSIHIARVSRKIMSVDKLDSFVYFQRRNCICMFAFQGKSGLLFYEMLIKTEKAGNSVAGR